MSYGIFVLARSFIRVDEVIFRSLESRLFIDIATGSILLERRVRDEAFSKVLSVQTIVIHQLIYVEAWSRIP